MRIFGRELIITARKAAGQAEWGRPTQPQDNRGQGPYGPPYIDTGNLGPAQIGTRPVQTQSPAAAGQSGSQTGGFRLRPVPIDDRIGLEYGTERFGIMRFFRAANEGYSSAGATGWPSTSGNNVVLKRPLMRFPTRGPRSISGAMNRRQGSDESGRAPTVFVPVAPLR